MEMGRTVWSRKKMQDMLIIALTNGVLKPLWIYNPGCKRGMQEPLSRDAGCVGLTRDISDVTDILISYLANAVIRKHLSDCGGRGAQLYKVGKASSRVSAYRRIPQV